MAETEPEPSADELLEALGRLTITDLVVQAMLSVSSLAWHKLSEEGRDLDQARLAIETLRAVVPVLKDAAPAEVVRDFEQATANLQLAYAKAVAG